MGILKYEFVEEHEITERGLRQLNFKFNDKFAYVLIEHCDHSYKAHLYIWGPAYDAYFLLGAMEYHSLEALEENMEREMREEMQIAEYERQKQFSN
ncbi:hypothetical protein CAL7716_059610 [Calothrix sp. PCC 7716]|nr:hypothetical protein CAL7716_059610 [Calothrix sp. PCC 7716]